MPNIYYLTVVKKCVCVCVCVYIYIYILDVSGLSWGTRELLCDTRNLSLLLHRLPGFSHTCDAGSLVVA